LTTALGVGFIANAASNQREQSEIRLLEDLRGKEGPFRARAAIRPIDV